MNEDVGTTRLIRVPKLSRVEAAVVDKVPVTRLERRSVTEIDIVVRRRKRGRARIRRGGTGSGRLGRLDLFSQTDDLLAKLPRLSRMLFHEHVLLVLDGGDLLVGFSQSVLPAAFLSLVVVDANMQGRQLMLDVIQSVGESIPLSLKPFGVRLLLLSRVKSVTGQRVSDVPGNEKRALWQAVSLH